MHNAHILWWMELQYRAAVSAKAAMAQLIWYTQLQLEMDPNWTPEHLRHEP